jgi:[acyl-carrier-protein] S-malonyltransferase
LAVSIAAHSPFMAAAQDDFNSAIASTPFNTPLVPIIGNVTAQPLLSTDDIRDDLQNQLTHKVRWTESMQYLIEKGISMYLEIGSGSVLSGLLKRINRNVITSSVGTPADFQSLQSL